MIKHSKPKSFFDKFTRKNKEYKSTHYCPGCGHGNAHKILAEVIDELNIQNRSIICSPVGCSVFAYNYFDTGNVQGAHGRNPAVATGIARTRKDAVIISYQGDGDLASIGAGAIVHAANRGENITVIFVNNAIYGMTGGQMAPTSIIGQKTKTSPNGRCEETDGSPIAMSEMLSSLKAPVFIERVSLSSASNIIKAKKAFKKALENQVNKKGFSFVEVLSPCPVNWKMTPVEAREWVKNVLEKEFPVKNFKDVQKEDKTVLTKSPMNDEQLIKLLGGSTASKKSKSSSAKQIDVQEIKIAGCGGQGIMSAGVLLANSAINENLNSTWLPSYGPEMRGGTANASVIISPKMIGSPLVNKPNTLIALNLLSLNSFESSVQPGGTIIVNSSLIKRKVLRDDVKVYYVPATEMAQEVGLEAAVTVIMVSIYAMASNCIELNTIKDTLEKVLKKESLIEQNIKAIELGKFYYRRHLSGSKMFYNSAFSMFYHKSAKAGSFL